MVVKEIFDCDLLEKTFLEHKIQRHETSIIPNPDYVYSSSYENFEYLEYLIRSKKSPITEEYFDNFIKYHKTLSCLIDRFYSNYSKADRRDSLRYLGSLINQEFKIMYSCLRGKMLLDNRLFHKYIGLWEQDDLDRCLFIFHAEYRVVPEFCKIASASVEGQVTNSFLEDFNSRVLYVLGEVKSWKQYCLSSLGKSIAHGDIEFGVDINVTTELLNYIIIRYLFSNRNEIKLIPEGLFKNYKEYMQNQVLLLDRIIQVKDLLLDALIYCITTFSDSCDIEYVHQYIDNLTKNDALYLVGLVKDSKFLETILRTEIKDYLPSIIPITFSSILLNELDNTYYDDLR